MYIVWDRGQNHPFVHEYHLSQKHSLKRLIFFTKWLCHPCKKSIDHSCLGLLLGSNSIPLVYISVLMASPHPFDYYSFVECFEMEKWESYIILLSQICFGCLESFAISYEFYDQLIHFWKKKKAGAVLTGLTFNLEVNLGSIVILTLTPLSTNKPLIYLLSLSICLCLTFHKI